MPLACASIGPPARLGRVSSPPSANPESAGKPPIIGRSVNSCALAADAKTKTATIVNTANRRLGGKGPRGRGLAFPSSTRRGGPDKNKMSRSVISRADGMVEPAERWQHSRPPRLLQFGGFAAFLFMSQPPLLVGNGP